MINLFGIQIDPKDISTAFVVMGSLVLIVSIIYSNLYGGVISLFMIFGVPLIIWLYRRRQEKNQNPWGAYGGGGVDK